MRIAVLHDWEPDYEQELTWQDGLAAALAVLATRHEVQIFTVGADTVIKNPLHDIITTRDPVERIKEFEPDVILHWADMTRPNARPCLELNIPMAICFAGGEVLGENMPYFDHIFVESSVYSDRLKDKTDATVSLAFGTNTTLFHPFDPPLNKMWDTIFPATFASWKRHYLYAQAVEGMHALACGYLYPNHEQDCWENCIKRGVTVMPHIGASTLRYLYGQSQVGVITSDSSGGSQRTILEMMSMNLPVVITDSDKYGDYIEACPSIIKADPNPNSIRDAIYEATQNQWESRPHILRRWSEFTYADALESGLKSIL